MNNWLLAGALSVPVAALGMAATLSSTNPNFDNPLVASSKESSFELIIENDTEKARASVETPPAKVKIAVLRETPDMATAFLDPLELFEVDAKADQKKAPQLVFARPGKSAYDLAASTLSADGHALAQASFGTPNVKTSKGLFDGLVASALSAISAPTAAPASSSLIEPSVAPTETSLFEDQFAAATSAPSAIAAVPLPAGLPMLLSGFVLLGLLVKRRATKHA
ncbi:MAG: hypothetical protein OXC60_03015 [Litoreibacter sp.]|nr:hypothetical protein [Litoreibacter sp.]